MAFRKTIVDQDWLGRKVVRVEYEDGTTVRHIHGNDWLGRRTTTSSVSGGRNHGDSWKRVQDRDWLGRKIATTSYSNGKKVRQCSSQDWLGRRVVHTEIISKGTKRCHRCGSLVSPSSDDTYSCCGRSWR